MPDTTKSKPPQQDAEEIVKSLPEDLQESFRTFQAELVKSIISQHKAHEGEEVVVKVTPDRVEWYKKRFNEVLESGFFNPHNSPAIVIKNK